jgi:hypothetical protein
VAASEISLSSVHREHWCAAAEKFGPRCFAPSAVLQAATCFTMRLAMPPAAPRLPALPPLRVGLASSSLRPPILMPSRSCASIATAAVGGLRSAAMRWPQPVRPARVPALFSHGVRRAFASRSVSFTSLPAAEQPYQMEAPLVMALSMSWEPFFSYYGVTPQEFMDGAEHVWSLVAC